MQVCKARMLRLVLLQGVPADKIRLEFATTGSGNGEVSLKVDKVDLSAPR